MLLSIIIPVYNQKGLIGRAIKSIPKRSDIEIIVIDDCSTDGTWEFLERYEGIILLRTPINGGPGPARNMGIDIAKGEYIAFLDSDDFYYTEKMNSFIDKYLPSSYDMIFYNLKLNSGTIVSLNENNCPHLCGAVKVIKRGFIGNTRFPSKYYAEDAEFNTQLLNKGPKKIFTNIPLYHYNFPREQSLSWKKKKELKNQKN